MPLRRSFRGPGTRSRREEAGRSVDDELRFHLDEVAEALVEEGMDPVEARAEARRRFGDLEATRTYCVEQQTRRRREREWATMIDETRQDLALALRTLRRSPAYAAVVILTLASGIAAGTLVFSILNPYFFRPLPFAEPDRLVQLGQIDPRYDWDSARFSLEMLRDYEARSEAFTGLAGYHYGYANLTADGGAGATRVMVGHLTDDMFDVLGTEAARGRTFAAGEEGPLRDGVAVLAHGLWQRRWGADPAALGSTFELDGVVHTVIGVMPPDFEFPFGEVQAWVPMGEAWASSGRADANHLLVGRLGDGWTAERARAELNGIQRALAGDHPDIDGRYAGISVKPLRRALNFVWDEMQLAGTVLLVAVLLVLTIACVNVAGITLARASRRVRDVAVRAALGAGRRRIVRHMVSESAVLAALGGGIGIAAAYGATLVLDPVIPAGIFKVGGIVVDGRVLAFSAAVTALTPLVFGLAPALRIGRTELATVLRSGGGGSAAAGLRARRALVVAQIALATVLVTGTGLMIRSVVELGRTDLGYDAGSLLTVEAIPPEGGYASEEEVDEYFRRATEELAAMPGAEGVGQIYPLPMNHESIPVQLARAGREPVDDEAWPTALHAWASPSYFATAGISLLAGRVFDATDRDGAPAVIVSAAVARRHFGEEDPVGRTLVVGSGRTPMTVVGVVEDVYHSGFAESQGAELPDPMLYRPLGQSFRRRRFLVVRTAGAPAALAGPARAAMDRVDGELSVAVRPLEAVVMENSFQWTVSSMFLAVFGLVAVALASLGIYGLVSYSVVQRRRELGVRVALGAGRGQIRRLVLREGAILALLGGGLGLVGALAVGRVIASFLYRVSPWDPSTLAAVVLVFTAVVLAATLLPARRATRVDPVRVLREE